MKRIYHTWDEWECYPAGFYEDNPPDRMTPEEAILAYRDFLADLPRFGVALDRVITEWKNSCEHYLTNEKMNRIAWLGQAAMCIETRVPSVFRGGFNKLSQQQQTDANLMALYHLNRWLSRRGEKALSMGGAESLTEANLY